MFIHKNHTRDILLVVSFQVIIIVLDGEFFDANHSFRQEVDDLFVSKARDAVVDRFSSKDVVSFVFVDAREVNDEVDFLLGDPGQGVVLVGRFKVGGVEGSEFDVVLLQQLNSIASSVETVSALHEVLSCSNKFLGGVAGDEDIFCLIRHFEIRRDRDHRLQEGFVFVLTETSDFTSGGHFDTENRVSAKESLEGELRGSDADVFQFAVAVIVGLDVFSQEDSGSSINEINVVGFRDEWETTRSAEISFNDRDIVSFN